MEIFQLRYFVSAARLEHFTRAAEENCVSQPSLSQQIAHLERELGAQLFVRAGRSVQLTDAGRALLKHAERILEEEAEARRAVQEVLGLRGGQVTIFALPTPGQYLLPSVLGAYRAAYPRIDITVREMVPAREIAEALLAGRADIGIVHRPYFVRGLEERVLLTDEMALVVPVGHPFTRRSEVRLEDAAAEAFVSAPGGASETHPLYAACLAAGFTPRIVCVSGSAQGMQALVAAGLGIAILPKLAIHPPAGAAVVELAAPRPTRILAAVWRADRLSVASAALLSLLAPPQ